MKQHKLGAAFNKALLPLRDLRVIFRGRIRALNRPRSVSKYDAVFHCCVQKTASRWLMNLLADPVVYECSGLTIYPYPPLPERVAVRDGQKSWPVVPRRKIISPLYYSFRDFQSIPKPEMHRAFFICRDPRDIVVSYYFSTRFSHRLNEKIAQRRAELSQLDECKGINKCIDYLRDDGVFDYLRSWISGAAQEQKVFRYEDLTGDDQVHWLKKLFAYLDIQMQDEEVEALAARHAFEKIAGRSKGSEDVNSHYRSGVSGDWKRYFDDDVRGHFLQVEPSLASDLGYTE